MTDKQIIIDDVDVSGCNRLNTFPMRYGIEPHEICLTSIEQWGGQEKYCKDRPNCYYKQLKRKEQECEELKNFHINLVGVKECEIKELVKYKQALTEIKEIAYELTNEEYTDFIESKQEQILQKCEVLDE